MTKSQKESAASARDALREAIQKQILKAEAKNTTLGSSWLEHATQRNESWWMSTVQGLVTKHSAPTDNPDHCHTNVGTLMRNLVELIVKSAPPDEVYDENMRTAAVMAAVCALWYSRLQIAKASDPNRPLFFRQLGYKRWLEFTTWMTKTMIDGRSDATYFPGQRWDFPFAQEAEGGEFI